MLTQFAHQSPFTGRISGNLDWAEGIEPASPAWKACVEISFSVKLSEAYPTVGLFFVGHLSGEVFGAGGGNRTRVSCLEGKGLTITQRPLGSTFFISAQF